jgi:hypothetical protein
VKPCASASDWQVCRIDSRPSPPVQLPSSVVLETNMARASLPSCRLQSQAGVDVGALVGVAVSTGVAVAGIGVAVAVAVSVGGGHIERGSNVTLTRGVAVGVCVGVGVSVNGAAILAVAAKMPKRSSCARAGAAINNEPTNARM